MDFSLSEDQAMLKSSAHDFLQKECPMTLVKEMAQDEKGYSPKLWHKIADLGWQGLIFPTDYEGAGGSFLDLVILLEEMGRALMPSPFFATVVMGGLSILEAGSKEQKKRYLPKVAAGDSLLTMAITEPGARYEGDPANIKTKATSNQGKFIINGTKLFVPYANVADYLVCVTRTDDKAKGSKGITMFIVDAKSPGITCTLVNTIGQDSQYEVRLENVTVSAQDILGKLDDGWAVVEKVLPKATVALCAYMNGSMQRILDMTVDYAKKRVQFGRTIGSFQAIQHNCADMLVALEASRVLTQEAAWKISQGVHCPIEVYAAKSWASESYRQVTWHGMQINGGISFVTEYDMYLFYRREKAAELTFGNAEFHQEAIARELLD